MYKYDNGHIFRQNTMGNGLKMLCVQRVVENDNKTNKQDNEQIRIG